MPRFLDIVALHVERDIRRATCCKHILKDTLEDTLEDTLKDTLEDTLEDTIEDTIKDKIKDTIKDTLKDTLTQSCATIPWNRGIARRKIVCTSCRSLIFICSWVATITGVANCNTFVVKALAILRNTALFASSEIHVGKPSHVRILRKTVFFLWYISVEVTGWTSPFMTGASGSLTR